MSSTANIHLRTSQKDKSLLGDAAEISGRSLTQFILDRVLPEARKIVASKHEATLSDAEWRQLAERLDAPPRELPQLRKLLKQRPGNW